MRIINVLLKVVKEWMPKKRKVKKLKKIDIINSYK